MRYSKYSKLSVFADFFMFFVMLALLGCFFYLNECSSQVIDCVRAVVFNDAADTYAEAMLIFSLLFCVVSYAVAIVFIGVITRFMHMKPFFDGLQRQSYRYFAVLCLVPLTAISASWGEMFYCIPAGYTEYIFITPGIQIALDWAYMLSYFVQIIMIILTGLAIFLFSYGLCKKFNYVINGLCIIFSAFYLCHVLYISFTNLKYGKWLLLCLMMCYTVLVALLICHKRAGKKALLPSYEVVVVSKEAEYYKSLLRDAEEDKYSDEDFEIFKPQSDRSSSEEH